MWTRSAKNKTTGLFTVTCTDWNGEQFFHGEFSDGSEANRAGEDAERRMTMKMQMPSGSATLDEIMSDDELLAALTS